jgi:hypothetical protein
MPAMITVNSPKEVNHAGNKEKLCRLFFSGFSTVVSLSSVRASIELPPEMMADKYLIKA